MALLSLLPDFCDIETQTPTADASGANKPTWAARLTGVSCSLQPVKAAAAFMDFSRRDLVQTYLCHFAQDVSLTTKDRILFDGNYYAVIAYDAAVNASITAETLYTATCTRRIG